MKEYKAIHENFALPLGEIEHNQKLTEALNKYAKQGWNLHTLSQVDMSGAMIQYRFILEKDEKPRLG